LFFLFIATNTYRKNPEALIEAFKIAFPEKSYPAQRVKLIMASTPPYSWGKLQEHNKDKRIEFDYKARTDEEIRELYVKSDCFVLPSRGEGFGLPVLEAMATGMPVITTDFGGVWDFCNPKLCYLVRVNGVVKASSPLKLEAKKAEKGLLVEVDHLHLVEVMQKVFKNQQEAMEKGFESAQEVRKNWSWETVISSVFPKNLLCDKD